ncbi:hypothetical protein [Nocardia macrotermitis]|uniref:Uncharacterized protein n=1 Tax=Nocardia macrotermitis TaxID=2585198 RepID=A0A7K0CW97_9NOCA|nr:hypothetical protein [Nocardia macrotermitis]MQY17698.1 hypothetical protein [Nocardia macrotermitis]
MADDPPWLTSISIWIERQARDYASKANRPDADEQELLETFEGYVDDLLGEFDPPRARRRAGVPVFAGLYRIAEKPPADEQGWRVPSVVLAALIAAELEFRGPLRLTARQNLLLATEYERRGAQLREFRLPRHAALAYQRAVALYRIAEDVDAADRCGLQLARARTSALPSGALRLVRDLSDALCGYGYRPFLLLFWVIVQLAVFTAIGIGIVGTHAYADTLYMSVTSFLNPAGLGDVQTLGRDTEALFAIETWFGSVSMSVFFALLVRKWFRM